MKVHHAIASLTVSLVALSAIAKQPQHPCDPYKGNQQQHAQCMQNLQRMQQQLYEAQQRAAAQAKQQQWAAQLRAQQAEAQRRAQAEVYRQQQDAQSRAQEAGRQQHQAQQWRVQQQQRAEVTQRVIVQRKRGLKALLTATG